MVDANRNQVPGGLLPKYCPSLDRIIILLDFDEYRVQVEGLENPHVRRWIKQDVPIVVATVHTKRILAINYAARQLLNIRRSKDETRSVSELVAQYGHLGLKIHYPKTRHGRDDMFTPEKYSNQVIAAIQSYRNSLRNKDFITIERAGLEEFYIDVTKLVNQRAGKNGLNVPFDSRLFVLCNFIKTHPNRNHNGRPVTVMEMTDKMVSSDELKARIFKFQEYGNANAMKYDLKHDLKLIHGGCIANAILRRVFSRTKLQASAGVGHTKELARHACSWNKPEGVSIFSFSALPRISPWLKIENIHGYGSGLAWKLEAEFINQNGQGRLSTFADVQQLRERAVDVLEGIFQELQYPEKKSPLDKAKELVQLCHGNDGKTVHEALAKRTMETSESIPKGLTPGQIKGKLNSLARDFADRIKFFKDAQGLTPKKVWMRIWTRSEGKLSWELMREHCPGWIYIFNFILNRIRKANVDRADVQKVELMVQYI